MEPRFAFTAQLLGDGAVVCRAIEDRPGPVVEQQFGEFPTWTQANAFAAKLNQGLDLDPLDVRQIVTSSLLVTACVVQPALYSDQPWNHSAVRLAAQEAHLRFVLAELSLALTLCRSASALSDSSSRRILLNARKALHHSKRFINTFEGDDDDLEGIAVHVDMLSSALKDLSADRHAA